MPPGKPFPKEFNEKPVHCHGELNSQWEHYCQEISGPALVLVLQDLLYSVEPQWVSVAVYFGQVIELSWGK